MFHYVTNRDPTFLYSAKLKVEEYNKMKKYVDYCKRDLFIKSRLRVYFCALSTEKLFSLQKRSFNLTPFSNANFLFFLVKYEDLLLSRSHIDEIL